MTTLAPFRYLLGYSEEAEPHYKKIIDEKHVEVRRYQSYLVAKIKIESESEIRNRESAYMRLLNYLLGKNSRRQKIEAVTPLIQEDVTSHVSALLKLSSDYNTQIRSFQISAILPEYARFEDAPLPLDPDIRIERVKPHLTAVLKFSGLTGWRKRERLAKYLSLWMRDRGYTAASAPRIAKYNPPFTLPFFRKNEIHIDVVKN